MSLYHERHPDGPEPAVRWLPFQLNPDLPEDGIPREDYVARKFGARGKGVNERVTLAGRQVGIPFAYEKMKVQPNTLNAHRLLCYAGLRSIPDYIYEAAEVDRASKWRQFWSITVPMLTPIIFFNLVMQTINGFQQFTQAFIVGERN